jgi:hypothetical protein
MTSGDQPERTAVMQVVRDVAATPPPSERPAGPPTHVVEVRTVVPTHAGPDLVRWGPVAAGALVGLAAIVLLGLVGLAVGLTAVDLRAAAAAGDLPPRSDRYAALWAVLSAAAAFFLGGYTAARAAGRFGRFAGGLNGALSGLVGLAALVWLAVDGLAGVLTSVDAVVFGLPLPPFGPFAGAAGLVGAMESLRSTLWATVAAVFGGVALGCLGGYLGARAAPASEVEVRRVA